MTCTHPDHNDHETCEDRAVGCSKDCFCCMGDPAAPPIPEPPLPLIHIDDADSAKARKLIGLLAMAKGSGASEQEMETALAAAQRFAIQHRIDINTIVVGQTGLSAPVEEMTEAVLKVGIGKRRPPANRFICSILQEFFNVEVLYGTAPDPTFRDRLKAWDEEINRQVREGEISRWEADKKEGPSRPSTVEFLGRRSDVAFATYAYGFLQTAFARAWRKYKNETFAPMSYRASFYSGIYDGLYTKLRRERRDAEQQLLGEAGMSSDTYALAVVTEKDQRQAFMKGQHPLIRTAKSAPVKVESYATQRAGRAAGEKITIAKALDNTKPAKPKPELA